MTRVPRKGWKKLCLEYEGECDCGEEHTEKWLQPVESFPAGKGSEEGESKKRKMCLGFQVADVKKPLVSVKRIVEQGNYVCFGPGKEDNYILSKGTGDKLMLRPNGKGSYLMDVSFVGGGRVEITVDSGAEESVCPWEWGSQFGTKPASKWMTFKNASGGFIDHYGTREVLVVSPF